MAATCIMTEPGSPGSGFYASSLTFSLQALLDRHEAYMASAERDRTVQAAHIEELQMNNAELETTNKKVAEENQILREQLEQLNCDVKDSETKANALEATLHETQLQVRRLEGATSRAAALERHILLLEEEQEALQQTLLHSEEEARTAMHRWKNAERAIVDLQVQLERMEQEARVERDRHFEVLDRMEKQRTLEKDLNAAASRLKGAAATKTLYSGKGSGSVVSHFVRDLLQDNANLQIGIAELREMLMNSNDEIQMLREQLQLHQPVPDGQVSAASTLRAELEYEDRPVSRVSQELHIHHHYHVSNHSEPRKSRKKRPVLSPSVFAAPRMSSTPFSSPSQMRLNRASPAPALVSHRHSDSLASKASAPLNPRWSTLSENPSEFAPSSVPSSPRSNPRNSMFDRGIADMSFPTSPATSVDPMSPPWRASHRKQTSQISSRSLSITAGLPSSLDYPRQPDLDSMALALHRPSLVNIPHTPYLLEDSKPASDELPEVTPTPVAEDSTVETTSAKDAETESSDSSQFDLAIHSGPALRRVVSHESIISLSGGLDIHTLKAPPSQLTLRQLGATAAGTNISTVTARPMMSNGSNGLVLRDNLAGLGLPVPRVRDRVVSGPEGTSPSERSLTPRQSSGALGKLVSWRPWGSSNVQQSPDQSRATTPTASTPQAVPPPTTVLALPSPDITRSLSTTPTQLRSPSSVGTLRPIREKDFSRAPGINQPGAIPIPGFYQYWADHQRRGPPSKVSPDHVDRDALREVLDEG